MSHNGCFQKYLPAKYKFIATFCLNFKTYITIFKFLMETSSLTFKRFT